MRLPDGEVSHCRRVAALSVEIGRRMRLQPNALAVVEAAAFSHHFPPTIFYDEPCDNLMTDISGGGWADRYPLGRLSDPLHPEVRATVAAINEPAADPTRSLAEIVEVANLFCEHYEFLPFEPLTIDQILDEIRGLTDDEFFSPSTVHALANLPRVRRDELAEIVYRLPVFPATALRALDVAGPDAIVPGELAAIAAADTDLTGMLLRISSSPVFGATRTASTIKDAIQTIGISAARKALMASVLRPYYAQATAPHMWKHAIAVAQLCEQLTLYTPGIPSNEAFLAGLVHEAGRVAFDNLDGEPGRFLGRLEMRGCEPVFSEKVVARFDHGEIGGDVLRSWNFPESIVEAVTFHHAPESSSSPFASLLYLAEFWSGSQEDVPSAYRLQVAMDRTGVTSEALVEAGSRPGAFDSLIT